MKQNIFQQFLGIAVLSSLPAILLIDNRSLLRFVIPFCVVMLPLTLLTVYFISTNKALFQSLFAKIIVVLTILMPFFLFASSPFTPFDLLMSGVLIVFGIVLPFWSIRATLWVYTLGGLTPLPDEHKWLLGKNKSVNKKSNDYKSYIEASSSFAFGIGYIIFLISRNNPSIDILLVMKILSVIIIFGLGIAIGTDLKKRTLQKLQS